MNLNVNNVSFGRWESATYARVLSNLEREAKARGHELENTPIYDNFMHIHTHTPGSELVFDQFDIIRDKNKRINHFPSAKERDNRQFRNINMAAESLRKDKVASEDEELGFDSRPDSPSPYSNSMYFDYEG